MMSLQKPMTRPRRSLPMRGNWLWLPKIVSGLAQMPQWVILASGCLTRRIARRTVQIACGSRGRNSISAPAACRPEAVGASEAEAAHCRSPNLRLALSAVPFLARSRGCLQARDAGALASERVRSVLALEVAPWCRQARGPGRHPRFDPDNQPRQPVVGWATDSWRAAETRYRHRPVDGRQVHVTGSRPTLSRLAGFPAQSHRPHRRPRSVRRADDRVQTALRAGHPASGAATARLDQGDSKSNGGVDRPADLRSIPMG